MSEVLTCKMRIDISIPESWGVLCRGILIVLVVVVLVLRDVDIVM